MPWGETYAQMVMGDRALREQSRKTDIEAEAQARQMMLWEQAQRRLEEQLKGQEGESFLGQLGPLEKEAPWAAPEEMAAFRSGLARDPMEFLRTPEARTLRTTIATKMGPFIKEQIEKEQRGRGAITAVEKAALERQKAVQSLFEEWAKARASVHYPPGGFVLGEREGGGLAPIPFGNLERDRLDRIDAAYGAAIRSLQAFAPTPPSMPSSQVTPPGAEEPITIPSPPVKAPKKAKGPMAPRAPAGAPDVVVEMRAPGTTATTWVPEPVAEMMQQQGWVRTNTPPARRK